MPDSHDKQFQEFLSAEKQVAGPMRLEAAYLIAAVLRAIGQAGVRGNVLEIGVFEGRSAIPAGCFLNDDEYFYAIDPFGEIQKDPKLTYGGVGNDVAFTRNWERVFRDMSRLRVLRATSEQVAQDKAVTGEWTPFKYVSVDGDHSFDGTLLDLRFAQAHVAADGVVAVDDVFNVEWPSVSQALYAFMGETDRLRPFCEGWGRVFLCHPSKTAQYQAAAKANFQTFESPLFKHLRILRTFPFFGVEIDVYTNRWGSASKPDLSPEAYKAGARFEELLLSDPARAAKIQRALLEGSK